MGGVLSKGPAKPETIGASILLCTFFKSSEVNKKLANSTIANGGETQWVRVQ